MLQNNKEWQQQIVTLANVQSKVITCIMINWIRRKKKNVDFAIEIIHYKLAELKLFFNCFKGNKLILFDCIEYNFGLNKFIFPHTTRASRVRVLVFRFMNRSYFLAQPTYFTLLYFTQLNSTQLNSTQLNLLKLCEHLILIVLN